MQGNIFLSPKKHNTDTCEDNAREYDQLVKNSQGITKAKKEKLRLRKIKCSVTVQRYLRKYSAKKVYFKLLSQAYD
jgi:hypothetical protein